jgi:hypothetical protein
MKVFQYGFGFEDLPPEAEGVVVGGARCGLSKSLHAELTIPRLAMVARAANNYRAAASVG